LKERLPGLGPSRPGSISSDRIDDQAIKPHRDQAK
jgi:hypothetical protein